MEQNILQKIADECGLSKSTVTKILNNASSFDIKTKEMVLKSAEAHGYSFKKQNSSKMKIGVLIPKTPYYFWEKAERGMCDELKRHNKAELSFYYYSDLTSPADVSYCIKHLLERNLPGYIIRPPKYGIPINLQEQLSQKPVGFIDKDFDLSGKLFYVGSDLAEEGIIASNLMHEKVGSDKHIVTLSAEEGDLRADSFKRNYQGKVSSFTFDFQDKLASAKIARILNELSPDGIYVSDGLMYIAGAAVYKLKKSIPIIGHEHSDSDTKYEKMGLIRAYIEQDIYHQGILCIEYMLNFLQNGQKPEYKEIITKPLVVM